MNLFNTYSLFILGLHWRTCEMSIGFNFIKRKYQNRHEWELGLHFYKYHKWFVVKTVYHKFNYICPDCGNILWKHNLYCDKCYDNFELSEVTKVEHKIF